MNEAAVMDVGRQAVQVALMVAMPMLAVSLIVGLVVSLFQVATSLQDVTLTFVPKIVAVGLTMIFAAHWIMQVLMSFTYSMLSDFSSFIS